VPVLVPCLAVIALGCGAAAQKGPAVATAADQPPTEIVHEECDLDAPGAEKIDVNNDGRPDIVRVMRGWREICRAMDFNFDGLIDTYLYFDDKGNVRRRESDFDRDGIIDEIAIYQNGVIQEKHRETNLDGMLDTWDTYVGGRLTRRMLDTNRDGRVDQWWTFPSATRPDCPIVELDETGNGRPTVRHNLCLEFDPNTPASRPSPPQPAAPPRASENSGK